MRSLLFVCLLGLTALQAAEDPGSVLIIVNDGTVPELGTDGKPASVYVGEYYAAARGIPATQILHINTPMACCTFSPAAWDSWHISFADFDAKIRRPLRTFLEQNNLKHKIKYIVTTYGVPSHISSYKGIEGPSVDAFLTSIYSPTANELMFANPYHNNEPSTRPQHLSTYSGQWPFYAVTRLDGPSAIISSALVDKAMLAERRLRKNSGTGYFDWMGSTSGSDFTMRNAFDLCQSKGFNCRINDQNVAKKMIDSAPDTLWAWGWYSGPKVNHGYRFVNGAVGSQLTSYTANSIRSDKPGAWVPLWLSAGITATWGATSEPYAFAYANGDNLLNRLWNGYNFGESAYLAAPYLNWMMVFIGDPLYSPTFTAPPVDPMQRFNDVPPNHEYFQSINAFKDYRITKGCSATPSLYCPDQSTSRGQMSVFIIRAVMGGDNFAYEPKPYFVDVPATHPYFKYVQKMKELKITRGCWTEPAYYCPDDAVPHGSMAIFLMRAAFGQNFDFSRRPYFTDVGEQIEAFPYIQKMMDLGIYKGCASGKFCINAPVTRAEMADWMMKTFYPN